MEAEFDGLRELIETLESFGIHEASSDSELAQLIDVVINNGFRRGEA